MQTVVTFAVLGNVGRMGVQQGGDGCCVPLY